jgi:hypothetical protein
MEGIFILILVVAVVSIVFHSVTTWVRMSQKYYENIERIRHGYPTLDGSKPIASLERREAEPVFEEATTFGN